MALQVAAGGIHAKYFVERGFMMCPFWRRGREKGKGAETTSSAGITHNAAD